MKGKLFGKEVEILIFDVEDEKKKESLLQKAYAEGVRLEKIFNLFDIGSELSRLNQSRKMKVSDELLYLIKRSFYFSELTNEEYDISFGKKIMERKSESTEDKLSCSFRDINIEGNMIELLHPDVLIDLGSSAKGYIVDRIVEFLKAKGAREGFIDGRGDVRVWGKKSYKLGIEHPRNKNDDIGVVELRNEAVATSGDYNQFYGSYDNSHILNQKDLISVTVTAPTLEEADFYATVLFIVGKNRVQEILNNVNGIKAFVVGKDLKVEKLGQGNC